MFFIKQNKRGGGDGTFLSLGVWRSGGKGRECSSLLAPFSGTVNFTVNAEALASQELCGNEVAVVPEYGKKDTIIKPLLVEVSNPAHLIGHNEPIKTMVNPIEIITFR